MILSIHWNMRPSMIKTRYSFFFLKSKLGFSRTDKYKKKRIECRKKKKLHYLKQIWFYPQLPNLILAWNNTKSASLNGQYPKLQFPTYTWFSHAQSRISQELPLICPNNVPKDVHRCKRIINYFKKLWLWKYFHMVSTE